MSQQYVLLRKENDLLNSLIGQSFNQKSKFEAEKILNEIHSKAQSRMIGKKTLCYIVDNSEIKGVGGSTLLKNKNGEIISNLILDQFGEIMAKFFSTATTATRSTVIKDTGNANRTLNILTGTQPFLLNTGLAVGLRLQVGSGSTPPTRTDFNIETAFGTAPENTFFVAGNPVWNSSVGNFKNTGSIIAGGAGTINESVSLSSYRDIGGLQRTFTLFRDIISPGQSFVVGQTISLEYTVQL